MHAHDANGCRRPNAKVQLRADQIRALAEPAQSEARSSAATSVRRLHGGCAWNTHTTLMTTFPVARPDSE